MLKQSEQAAFDNYVLTNFMVDRLKDYPNVEVGPWIFIGFSWMFFMFLHLG